MRWSEAGDAALLAATAREPEAFMAFYERYESAVIGFFLRRVGGNVEVAVDLASETFAAALTAASRYRAPEARGGAEAQEGSTSRGGSAAPWLFTIAANVLRDSLRRGRVEARARRRIGIREAVVYEDDELERIEERVSRPRDLASRLLDELPGPQRDAVWARVVEERGYGDIARAMQTSELVVRKRVSRGLQTMRHQIEEEAT